MKEIIINSNPYEKRVSLLEDRLLTEIYIERRRSKRINGNIYKGRVTRVLPGMQAAFVDIGIDRDAFLYVVDVNEPSIDYENITLSDEADPVLNPEEESFEEPFNNSNSEPLEGKRYSHTSCAAIEDLLKEGQELLVQVSKEPLGTKGARVTTHITLPGRYLVFMPTVDHIGISRKIEDKTERNRLRDLIDSLKKQSLGYIVRTVGEGKDEKHFLADIQYLSKLWEKILVKSDNCSAPYLVHRELDILLKTLRDILTNDVDQLLIDSKEEYNRCMEFVENFLPSLTDRLKLYTKSKPIFDEYDIDRQIEEALSPKVWLKSGGYIVIDETEALVAIDVNTGKFVGESSLEETIFKINIEAIKEIVRQVRLRDLGGIIIIDFIDMENEENRQNLLQELEEELKRDRMRTKVLQLSELGLVEMTRKRIKQSLSNLITTPCPYCKGTGRVKSVLTICRTIQREIDRLAPNCKGNEIIIKAHPNIAAFFYKQEDTILEYLEGNYNKRITIRSDPELHYEQYDIVVL